MLKMKFTFDDKTYRHAMNGHESVLHCHHYMSLTTKLAQDFNDVGGVRILRETAEDSIRPLLDSYFSENGVTSPDERLKLGAEYYAVMGMGLMDVTGNDKSGKVVLKHSHVDEGWIKKWGKRDKPVNFITCGYIAGVFAAVFDRDPRTYLVGETDSIVTGADRSKFQVVAR